MFNNVAKPLCQILIRAGMRLYLATTYVGRRGTHFCVCRTVQLFLSSDTKHDARTHRSYAAQPVCTLRTAHGGNGTESFRGNCPTACSRSSSLVLSPSHQNFLSLIGAHFLCISDFRVKSTVLLRDTQVYLTTLCRLYMTNGSEIVRKGCVDHACSRTRDHATFPNDI